MKCFSCGNKIYDEKFFDQEGNFGGWKCLYCSEIVDEVIMENRNHFGEYRIPRPGEARKEMRRR